MKCMHAQSDNLPNMSPSKVGSTEKKDKIFNLSILDEVILFHWKTSSARLDITKVVIWLKEVHCPRYEQFLLFPQCFQNTHTVDT